MQAFSFASPLPSFCARTRIFLRLFCDQVLDWYHQMAATPDW